MSKKKGRNTAWANLIGPFKYHGILKASPKYPSGEFSKRAAMRGGGVILASPPPIPLSIYKPFQITQETYCQLKLL